MDIVTLFMLGFAVFGASCLQTATGIGYGVIAGPIFLVVLNGPEAFQMSTLHNTAIALMLLPVLWSSINKKALRLLVASSSGGLVIGFALQLWIDVLALKILATLMIGFVTVTLARDMMCNVTRIKQDSPSTLETSGIGMLAGIMGGMLAMPGPLAATWMSAKGFQKQEIRATVLAFFVFAYGANAILYAGVTGFSTEILKLTLLLMMPLIFGIIAGNRLAGLLNEKTFRWILLMVLLSTLSLLTVDWSQHLW
jgi:uncharacterized membrane protein YfcA